MTNWKINDLLDFVEFFQAVDVDQSIEDFLKAYWLYPNYIRFEIAEVEPL